MRTAADHEAEHEAAPLPAAQIAAAPPAVAQVLALQRSAGNRAVAQMLQRYNFNAGEGTTAELQAERARIEQQRSDCYRNLLWGGQICDVSYGEDIRRLDLLLAERGDSTLADAPQELRFDGHTLTMTGTGGGSWPAVSGRPDASGSFDYSPARQRMENVGPIPVGVYWIDPRQLVNLQDKWFYERLYAAPWGTHRITIHPFSTTHTFGRGGFFIHGGSTPGSAGCIDLTSNMSAFAAALGNVTPGQKVKLTVSY